MCVNNNFIRSLELEFDDITMKTIRRVLKLVHSFTVELRKP